MRTISLFFLSAAFFVVSGRSVRAEELARQIADTPTRRIFRLLEETATKLEPFLDLNLVNSTEGMDAFRRITGKIHQKYAGQVRGYLEHQRIEFRLEENDFFRIKRYVIRSDTPETSKLNLLATYLAEYGIEVVISPDLLRQGTLGNHERYDQRINLVFPPIPDLTVEFLAHEVFHALVVNGTSEGDLVHLQRGRLTRGSQSPTSKGHYSSLDLSELGAYAESLRQLGLSMRSNPTAAQSRSNIRGVLKAAKYLVEFTGSATALSLEAFYAMGVPDSTRMIVVKQPTSRRVDLWFEGRNGSVIDLKAFAAPDEIPELAQQQKRYPEQSIAILDVETFSPATKFTLRKRLADLRSIHMGLRNQVEAYEGLSLAEKIANSEEPTRWMHDANQRWLRALNLDPVAHAEDYAFDREIAPVLNCGELLR